jgi:uncharacterized protein (DUF3820 family)
MVRVDDSSLMPFGKYKGYKLANVPAEYLLYIYDNFQLHDNLKEYIKMNKDVLQAEVKRASRENRK